MLIGIRTPNTGSHLIQGMVMDRKQRDNFRIGLDNLVKELSDPYPCFDRYSIKYYVNIDFWLRSLHYVLRKFCLLITKFEISF